MATTIPTGNASKSSSKDDEKKDEEELNMISSLETLFEEYRVVHELAFDITKHQKSQKLSDITKKIESIIESIEHRYPYKQTLNIKHNAKNKQNRGNNNSQSTPTELTESQSNGTEEHSAYPDIATNETMNIDYSCATISRAHYLYFVGRYYKIRRNLSTASPLLQEAIKLNPDLIECWNTLGDIYYEENELTAAKFCFESALEYDGYNKISYLSLSKILRKPTGKDQMEIMENCIESLILAKFALKYGKKCATTKHKNAKNSLKDGELWFNLGNAYLMTFLNCINGWKLDSSVAIEKEQKENGNERKRKKDKDKEKEKDKKNQAQLKEVLNALDDDKYFESEYEAETIRRETRREIETELNDESNNLLHHVYIKKCLSAYKCAATKCSMNKHSHHPDLYCNRSHIHIYQENYAQALQDLKFSMKYALIDEENGESSAKVIHDELLPKLCKISKQIANKGGNKMQKKIVSMAHSMKQYMKQCSDYYTKQLHYDLVHFTTLNEGLNGGNVIVIKLLALMQPANQLPLHFICIDGHGAMFVLSFYLRGHALNHIYKILNQMNSINPQTLICVANPVKRQIKFTHGSKHIQFHTISFQKPQDICIGGKFFFNQ